MQYMMDCITAMVAFRKYGKIATSRIKLPPVARRKIRGPGNLRRGADLQIFGRMGYFSSVTKKLHLILFIVFFAVSVFGSEIRDLKPTVILISLDGFRYDYLERYKPPLLTELARNGVRAKWMIPSFPTKTFPNHYTVATGLYPANHGIVENNVYDFGEVFTMSKRKEVENPRWWLGEPIWVTAEKQGRIAASYFFVGTETKIHDEQPTIWRPYNGQVPNEMRVDKVLAYLDLPVAERPTMISMYFSDTDDVGHEFGPDAEETKYAVWGVDRDLRRLVDGLKARKIDDQVHLIIVSDHGMANYSLRNATFLDDHFDFGLTERILWTNEIIQIFPKEGKLEEIYGKVKDLPHVTCWRKAEIPARLKYSGSRRIAPIVCSTEIGWITTSHKRFDDWSRDMTEPEIARFRGAHGYDNKYQEMQATFIAHGGRFRKGLVVEPFENVNVYNLMCRILGLRPAPNDGNRDLAGEMLR